MPTRPADPMGDVATARPTVQTMLGSLPAQHREIILATYFRRRTIRQAARQLGLAPGTARARLYAAMRDLSDMLATSWPGQVDPHPAARRESGALARRATGAHASRFPRGSARSTY